MDDMIGILRLTDKRDVYACNLSGGMKRKLSVGIALIAGSKVGFTSIIELIWLIFQNIPFDVHRLSFWMSQLLVWIQKLVGRRGRSFRASEQGAP